MDTGGRLRSLGLGLLLSLLTGAGYAQPAVHGAVSPINAVNFYVVAHADDWVLFMNPFRDVTAKGSKTVFIYTTAGDAGLGAGPTPLSPNDLAPYYLARENGAFRALRFLADLTEPIATPESAHVLIKGHSLFRTSYKNTVSYYLRLPDGGAHGQGYAQTGKTSLTRFHLDNGALTAVDASTSYIDWLDLISTLVAIIKTEGRGVPKLGLHFSDPDPLRNPKDHADHIATGQAMLEVHAQMPCTEAALYVGAAVSGMKNLDDATMMTRAALFGNMVSGRAEMGWPGTWDASHTSYLSAVVSTTLNGTGPCRY